jgi:hypothetical protein
MRFSKSVNLRWPISACQQSSCMTYNFVFCTCTFLKICTCTKYKKLPLPIFLSFVHVHFLKFVHVQKYKKFCREKTKCTYAINVETKKIIAVCVKDFVITSTIKWRHPNNQTCLKLIRTRHSIRSIWLIACVSLIIKSVSAVLVSHVYQTSVVRPASSGVHLML